LSAWAGKRKRRKEGGSVRTKRGEKEGREGRQRREGVRLEVEEEVTGKEGASQRGTRGVHLNLLDKRLFRHRHRHRRIHTYKNDRSASVIKFVANVFSSSVKTCYGRSRPLTSAWEPNFPCEGTK
jgi:hypothetical protein